MQPIILERMNKKVKYQFCYEPEDGWVGDVIPCSDGKELFLYYLKEKRIDGIPANRTTWNLLTGTSPVELKEYGIALPTEENRMWTGAAIQDQLCMREMESGICIIQRKIL